MTPASSHIDPDGLAGASALPAPYETALRRVLRTHPDGGGSLIERLLTAPEPIAITLPHGGKTLLLFFDPDTATLVVRDPNGPNDQVWRWRRLRRLVLRDRLLRSLSARANAAHELSPQVRQALRYPRPDPGHADRIPALNQLRERSDARLDISETVTFDRLTVPPIDTLEEADMSSLRRDIRDHLAALSGDQTAAMVQDSAFENATPGLSPVVFPLDATEELMALVRHANPPGRSSVSLVLPVEATLSVDLGPDQPEETASAQVALLYLDLEPGNVMAAIRENTLLGAAEAILEQNGLSLLSLSIREARAT